MVGNKRVESPYNTCITDMPLFLTTKPIYPQFPFSFPISVYSHSTFCRVRMVNCLQIGAVPNLPAAGLSNQPSALQQLEIRVHNPIRVQGLGGWGLGVVSRFVYHCCAVFAIDSPGHWTSICSSRGPRFFC